MWKKREKGGCSVEGLKGNRIGKVRGVGAAGTKPEKRRPAAVSREQYLRKSHDNFVCCGLVDHTDALREKGEEKRGGLQVAERGGGQRA